MKKQRIGIRINEELKRKLENISHSKGISVTEIFEIAISEYINTDFSYKVAEETIEKVSLHITQMQAQQLSDAEKELLSMLNMCYELLARTSVLYDNPRSWVETPAEMKDSADDMTYKYGTGTDERLFEEFRFFIEKQLAE